MIIMYDPKSFPILHLMIMMMMVIWTVFILFHDAKTKSCHLPIRNATQTWFQHRGDLQAWTTQSDDDDDRPPSLIFNDFDNFDDNDGDPARVALLEHPVLLQDNNDDDEDDHMTKVADSSDHLAPSFFFEGNGWR